MIIFDRKIITIGDANGKFAISSPDLIKTGIKVKKRVYENYLL